MMLYAPARPHARGSIGPRIGEVFFMLFVASIAEIFIEQFNRPVTLSRPIEPNTNSVQFKSLDMLSFSFEVFAGLRSLQT